MEREKEYNNQVSMEIVTFMPVRSLTRAKSYTLSPSCQSGDGGRNVSPFANNFFGEIRAAKPIDCP